MSQSDTVSRRSFIRNTAAGLAVGALASPDFLARASTNKSKPNILLIISDEHNAKVAGFNGNKIARTPHMDALAATGVTLENHYCNSPICSPSRNSITSGKYISRVSAWNNNCWLPSADIPSIARCMTAAGYESFLCGKMHYDYSRRYGFTDVGSNSNNNYKRGLDTRHDPTKLVTMKTSNWFDDFHPGDESTTIRHDQKVTAGALDFFKTRTGNEKKPFFLLVGYLAPHFPIIAPESYWDNYKGKIGMPEIPAGFLDSLPVNYKCLRAGFQEENVAPDVVLRGRELYYALTEWVDNEIGKVLAAMRAHPAIAENTIIIYTSDHGENMGEHGMWWKNCMYDQATKVPTIFNFPQRWKGGQRRPLVSSHVDLVKTIIDLGGGTTPADWNGDSMVPYLDNHNHAWKDFALSEYYAHNIASGYVMVRTGNWKYTYHTTIDAQHPEERQLYDLSTDPQEFKNLAAAPEYADRVKMMHAMMLRELGGVDPNVREQQCRKEIAVGYNRTDKKPKGGNGGQEGD